MQKLAISCSCALLSLALFGCKPSQYGKIEPAEDTEKIYQEYLNQMSSKYKQKTAPNVEISLLDGSKSKLSDYVGKVVLLNFWFVNCPPCLTEIASLNELQKNYKDKDVVVVSIGLDDVDRLKYVSEAKKIEYVVGANGKTQGDTYGVNVYPTSFLIDKKGVVQEVFVGASDWDATYTYTEIKPHLEKLLQTQ